MPDYRDNEVDKEHALHTDGLGSISGTPYDSFKHCQT